MAKESGSGANTSGRRKGSKSPAQDPISALAKAIKDPEERWLVCKDGLDYGPYSVAALVQEIREDRIVPGQVIVDKHTSERVAIEEHPLVGQVVRQAAIDRNHRRRANAEHAHASTEKKRGLALYAVLGIGIIGLAVAAFVVVSKVKKAKKQHVGGVTALAQSEVSVHFGADMRDRRPRKSHKGTSRTKRNRKATTASNDSDMDTLDFSKEGGDERLDNGTINAVVRGHTGRLGSCLRKAPERYAKINFSIRGADGRVSSVKVNGSRSGGLYSCLNRAMRAMKFPTFDGTRTRAVFDMSQ